jgi:hypothetical protein
MYKYPPTDLEASTARSYWETRLKASRSNPERTAQTMITPIIYDALVQCNLLPAFGEPLPNSIVFSDYNTFFQTLKEVAVSHNTSWEGLFNTANATRNKKWSHYIATETKIKNKKNKEAEAAHQLQKLKPLFRHLGIPLVVDTKRSRKRKASDTSSRGDSVSPYAKHFVVDKEHLAQQIIIAHGLSPRADRLKMIPYFATYYPDHLDKTIEDTISAAKEKLALPSSSNLLEDDGDVEEGEIAEILALLQGGGAG